jgi:hypothetical protein
METSLPRFVSGVDTWENLNKRFVAGDVTVAGGSVTPLTGWPCLLRRPRTIGVKGDEGLTRIRLKDDEAAVIIGPSNVKVTMPQTADVPEHVQLAAAIGILLKRDKRWVAGIWRRWNKLAEECLKGGDSV